jgi:hypothetical protein
MGPYRKGNRLTGAAWSTRARWRFGRNLVPAYFDILTPSMRVVGMRPSCLGPDVVVWHCTRRGTGRARSASARRAGSRHAGMVGLAVGGVSALTRLERAVALDAKAVATSFERLKQLADSWHEVEPGGIVRESGVRFLRVSFVGDSRCSTTCSCLRRSRAPALAAIRNAR